MWKKKKEKKKRKKVKRNQAEDLTLRGEKGE